MIHIVRTFAARVQAGVLLMCLVFGTVQGLVLLISHAPDCCASGVCPLHRAPKTASGASSDCDHEHGKSDCSLKCGMPKVNLAGILPILPEIIFPAADTSQELIATRFEVSPIEIVVPQVSFSPPEQPPRS